MVKTGDLIYHRSHYDVTVMYQQHLLPEILYVRVAKYTIASSVGRNMELLWFLICFDNSIMCSTLSTSHWWEGFHTHINFVVSCNLYQNSVLEYQIEFRYIYLSGTYEHVSTNTM